MIDTDKLRRAVANYRATATRRRWDTGPSDIVVELCDEIDKLREESAALRDWATRLENLYRNERITRLDALCALAYIARFGDAERLARFDDLCALTRITGFGDKECQLFKGTFDTETEQLLNDCSNEEVQASLDSPSPLTFIIKDGKRSKVLQDLVDRYFIPQ